MYIHYVACDRMLFGLGKPLKFLLDREVRFGSVIGGSPSVKY